MEENAIEVLNVDHSFRKSFFLAKTKVLNNINLSIKKQNIFGFLGANGAGKTTLIHLITGLRKPQKGRITVFNQDACSITAKLKMGYLPERPYFHDHLTAQELLVYFGQLAGLSKKKILSRLEITLKEVDLLHAKKIELKKFSKGMLQRIGIAQALIHEPEILVLDEPMSGLDPIGRKEIRELILSLSKKGRTIFFSSHVIPDVEAICDQVGIIDKGKIIACGPILQFLQTSSGTTEIIFKGLIKNEHPYYQQIEKISEGYRLLLPTSDKITETLRNLIALNTEIISVTPVRQSLEKIFEKSYETT